jgi:hypothetical protein
MPPVTRYVLCLHRFGTFWTWARGKNKGYNWKKLKYNLHFNLYISHQLLISNLYRSPKQPSPRTFTAQLLDGYQHATVTNLYLLAVKQITGQGLSHNYWGSYFQLS